MTDLTSVEASDEVKAILEVHSHLLLHTKEPYTISSRESHRLKGPLLKAAVKLEKLERLLKESEKRNSRSYK